MVIVLILLEVVQVVGNLEGYAKMGGGFLNEGELRYFATAKEPS